ncbi:Gfo/Idh/MocA family protein [Paenibacillus thalictri]|uniref:Gfo/Idh/MocA family oxidoreductase n=1 Tax=Paenibacillus thalictri TaxID=2527873 RepID=A0A4Q9DVZ9_9BACL|nr:Gfo/Idh/MocA family oxidoreductase [Paenibacillus thalictri]TBL80556.1 Gfo/Idh/MocA family oxidoreductase [Paenibacillus thalictri]
MESTIKAVIAGCGATGSAYASCFLNMPQVEVTAVYDKREEAAGQLAGRCGAQAFTSFERMFSETAADVVCICLPAALHKEFAFIAAFHGKHIICHTPIAPNLSDAQTMIEVCREKGVKLYVAQSMRFLPQYANLRREIRSGSIGSVGVAHMKRTGPAPFHAEEAVHDDGSVILDWMLHDIDITRSVLGEVKSVYAMNRKTGKHDYALATLRFESGAIANLEAYMGHPEPMAAAVEFAGNGGLIRFNSSDAASMRIRKNGAQAAASAPGTCSRTVAPIWAEDAYMSQLEHFIACLRQGREPDGTAYDAYKALEIALAAVLSSRTGVPAHIGTPSVTEEQRYAAN